VAASSLQSGMRAVVAGGAGFLGSHLCERFVAHGIRVTCVDNFITGSATNVSHLTASPLFTLINRDITEDSDASGPVEYVFHLASPASPADYLRLPVQTLKAGNLGTIHALELAGENGRGSSSRPVPRFTVTPVSIPSGNRTGGTSTPSAYAAPTTKPSGSRRRLPSLTRGPVASALASPASSTATGRACGQATAVPSRHSSARR
jgi:nucleoside-diphosphate-sugar epimerase